MLFYTACGSCCCCCYFPYGSQLVIKNNAVGPRSPMYNLQDAAGHWAGMIYHNGVGSIGVGKTESCDFIVVSGGTTSKDEIADHNRPIEWAQVSVIQGLTTCELYNVLWIEWKGGFAYRNAVGKAGKEA